MKKSFLLILIAFQWANSNGQTCDSDLIVNRSIKAFTTDNNIDFELKNHQVYINPACIQNEKLLLHLVGTFDNPESTNYFPTIAANNGYRVIALKYPNKIAAKTACSESTDLDCFTNFREEIIFGDDLSSAVDVDFDNSIINRTEKLLTYLQGMFSTENWDDFLSSDGTINWSNIVISGHSQGGGHAGYIAKRYEVSRVLMFAAPNDYSDFYSASANWVSTPSETPDSNYYAFGNLFDDIVDFEKQFEIWGKMKLNEQTDSINIDDSACNYNNSKILYTKDQSSTVFSGYHNSVIIDNFTPLTDDIPNFTPVWEYMLGICDGITSISNLENNVDKIKVYPNPSSSIVFVENDEIITRLEIFDSSGKQLLVIHPQQSNFTLDLVAYKGLLTLKFSVKGMKEFKYKLVLTQ